MSGMRLAFYRLANGVGIGGGGGRTSGLEETEDALRSRVPLASLPLDNLPDGADLQARLKQSAPEAAARLERAKVAP